MRNEGGVDGVLDLAFISPTSRKRVIFSVYIIIVSLHPFLIGTNI